MIPVHHHFLQSGDQTDAGASPSAVRDQLCCGGRRSLWGAPQSTRLLSSSPVVDIVLKSARLKKDARNFEKMLLALPVFHETVGHFMVPFHMRIPSKNDTKEDEIRYRNSVHVYGLVQHVSEIEWPDEAQGLGLGSVVAMFMSNPDHHTRHPWVKERLQAMGFPVDVDWRLYVWQHQRMAAIKCFYDLHGHTNTKDFVVPRDDHDWPVPTWGFPLGSFISTIRLGEYKITSSQRQELEDIAFRFGPWEAEWHEKLLPALQTFARIHGHLNVDESFTVPRSEPWPEKMWGMQLGYRIHRRWQFVELLKKLSRECDVLKPIYFDGLDRQWDEQIMPSLEVFRTKFQHCVVHRTFVVPEDASWPQAAWGLELGKVVAGVVSHGFFQDQIKRDHQRLQKMDFCWDRGEYKWTGVILPSLETFYQVYGHANVPHKFEVPSESPWAREAWAVRLGDLVTHIRSDGYLAEQVVRDGARLEAIGFVWDLAEHSWTTLIRPALETFFQVHGHSQIPQQFVVPSESPWPETTWGFNLGITVNNIRAKGYYPDQIARDAEFMTAINFVWNDLEHKWTKIVLPSLQAFRQVYGHCNVPHDFVAPSNKSPWPKDAWGLPLGSTVSNIRSNGQFAEQVARDPAQLDAIGFVWDPRRDRWENVVLPAFECFHRLHGDLHIPRSFVVPSEASWPVRSWGVKLGAALSNIRARGDYADERERDHRRMVAIDFPAIITQEKETNEITE